MLDAVMIAQDTERPPSPTISDTPNGEHNQGATPVHFGPFQTPEEQLTTIVAIPDPNFDNVHSLPLQDALGQSGQRSRSSSLSTSTASDEIMVVERLVGLGEDQEDGAGLDVETPQPGGLPDADEPSSALANRLLRALDNPSPPPSPTLLPTSSGGDETEAEEEDEVDSATEDEALFIAPIPSLSATAPQTTPASEPQATSEPDLMTFDSFDGQLEPVTTLSAQLAAQAPSSPFSFSMSNASYDAPTLQAVESSQGHTDVLIDLQDKEPDIISIQEDSQQDEGVGENSPPVVDPPEERGLAPTSKPTPDLPPNPEDPSLKKDVQNILLSDESPHTPLRRSSRPRKSAMPHTLKYLTITSPNKDVSPSLSTPQSRDLAQKNKKGKERAMSPPGCDADMEKKDADAWTPGIFNLDEKPLDVKAQRRYSRSPVRREITRDLGSLSPQSADFLTRLVSPAPARTTESTSAGDPEHSIHPLTPAKTVSEAPSNDTASPITQNSTKPEPVAESTMAHATAHFASPGRIPVTPRKTHTPHSPSKLRLQSVPMDDPTRTPARRIPIEQAIVEGHMSPQKLSQLQTGTPAPVNIFTGQAMPVLNMSLGGDSSPARRVFVAPHPSSESTSHPEGPTKPQPGSSVSQQLNRVITAPVPKKAPALSRPAKLPFPLVPTSKTQPSVKKDGGKLGESSLSSSSPAKSSLKQTTSRIPRKKPYSRSNIISHGEQKTVQKPTTMLTAGSSTLAGTSVARKPSPAPRIAPSMRNEGEKRVIRAVDLSKTTTTTRAPNSSSSDPRHLSTDSLPDTNTGNLKRKRLNSKTPPASSSRPTTSHQVTTAAPSPATASSARPITLSSSGASKPISSARATGQAAQKPTVGKFRRVMPPELPAPLPPTIPKEAPHLSVLTQQPVLSMDGRTPNKETEVHLSPGEDMILSSPTSETRTQASSLSSSAAIAPSTSHPPPPPSVHPPLVFVIDPLSPAFESTPLPESSSDESGSKTNTRRTTRLRKAAQPQPGQDVFDSDPSASYNNARPLQRRRMNASQNLRSNTDDAFSGMSMTALKALTVNNTLQNQYYAVAKLETEIVRKEGARPESPAVKIKTIVQRQQEEKAKQREERAARRARRHGTTDSTDGDDGVNGDDAGYESSTPGNDMLVTRMETLLKHRRGAGDEEDYETPLKTISGENGKRRVKWDKGLFTEVFLDEVVLGSKAPPKENFAAKGCLTASAKTLQLNTLGNLVDPEKPLLDLTQEHITVKKYVYDDDVDVEAAPQPATPVIRNTRSKSKKSKS